jgi:two-component system, OmpR family, response regulator
MTTQKTILVVDDDPDGRRVLMSGLAPEGFAVIEAGSREAAISHLRRSRADLVTLDIGPGQEDGLEVAREIRTIANVPILVITERAAPIDRVRGLEQGADDYVVKPFHIREIVLRVRALLKRYDNSGDDRRVVAHALSFDRAILDLRRRELRGLDGKVVDITETEFRLLELFLRHAGKVLSRDEINSFLRGRDWSPLDRTLDGHVARLRRKIEPLADEPHVIRSVRGVGYLFRR